VKSAELKDGLLAIELVREIPEEMKPRKIAIDPDGATRQNETIEAQQAA
jgi:molecular chaperone IbpA